MTNYQIKRYDQIEDMKEAVSLPRSLRDRLDLAQDYLCEGRSGAADQVINNAMSDLARSSPELFTILMAIQHGYRGVRYENVEATTSMQRVEKRWCGFVVGESWTPHTTIKRTVKTISFLK